MGLIAQRSYRRTLPEQFAAAESFLVNGASDNPIHTHQWHKRDSDAGQTEY